MALTVEGFDLAVSFATNVVIAVLFLAAFEAARHAYPYLYNRRRTLEVTRPAPAALGAEGPTAAVAGETTSSMHLPLTLSTGGSAGPPATPESAVPVAAGPSTTAASAPLLPVRTMVELGRATSAETRGLFGWVRPTVMHNEAWILAHRGRDAAMYLRFVWAMLWLFVGLLVGLFIVIVPANASGTNKDLAPTDPNYVAGLLIISMANVAADDTILWLHAIVVPIVTSVACVVAYQLQRQYLLWQVEVERPTRISNRAILVRGVRFGDADGHSRFDLLRPLTATVSRVGDLTRAAATSVLHQLKPGSDAAQSSSNADGAGDAKSDGPGPASVNADGLDEKEERKEQKDDDDAETAETEAQPVSETPLAATSPAARKPSDPAAGEPVDPAAGEPVDPVAEEPADPVPEAQAETSVERWARIERFVLDQFNTLAKTAAVEEDAAATQDLGGAVERVHLVRRDPRLTSLWALEKKHTRALRRAVFNVPADILRDAAVREHELAAVPPASRSSVGGGNEAAAVTGLQSDTDGNVLESPLALAAAERADAEEVAEAEREEQEVSLGDRELNAVTDSGGAPAAGAAAAQSSSTQHADTTLDSTVNAERTDGDLEKGGDDQEEPTPGCCGRAPTRAQAATALGWTAAERRRKLVDRIAHARRRLHRVRTLIGERQAATPTALAGVGLVVFRSATVAAAAAAAALAKSSNNKKPLPSGWDVFRPSSRRDVNWPWLYVKSVEQATRRLVAWAVVTFLVFFWSIPATFVQGLGNLRELATTPAFSWLNPILDFLGPTVEALLDAYLPSLFLVLLLASVPPLLRALTVREGYVTNLMTERVILLRFYLFLIVNVLLVSTIAGSVLGQIEAIVSREASVASLLAVSLPSQGPFFIGYLMVKFCFATMDLLRPHILALFAVRAVGRSAAVDDFVIEYRPTLDFGPRFAWDLLVVALGLTYSLLYPFILIFAVAYFAIVALVHRHNIIFLHRPRVELQGQLWPRVRTLFFVGVLVFQWTMVGWFSLQQSAALVFPILGTVILSIAWYKINRLTVATARDVRDCLHAVCRRTVGEHAALLPARNTRAAAAPAPAAPSSTAATPPSAKVKVASELDLLDDDDFDGFSVHGRITRSDVERDYFVEPIMYPPAPDLLDDPFNPFRPQL